MARLTCLDCHMQYNQSLGACPNCGTRPPSLWRRMTQWRWPLPLAIGIALQFLSQHGQLERAGIATHKAVSGLPEAALVSQFVAGVLIFSSLAAFLLFAIDGIRIRLRRQLGRRRRARHPYPGQPRSG